MGLPRIPLCGKHTDYPIRLPTLLEAPVLITESSYIHSCLYVPSCSAGWGRTSARTYACMSHSVSLAVGGNSPIDAAIIKATHLGRLPLLVAGVSQQRLDGHSRRKRGLPSGLSLLSHSELIFNGESMTLAP